MKKMPVLIQTFLLVFLPLCLMGFNIPLSFSPNAMPQTPTDSLEAAPDDPPIEEPRGKFIKESLKAKGVYQIKTIVIDPGHGGHDPGCSGANSREKHLALAIGKKFAAAIRGAYPELKVIMTRDKDVFIPLHQRAAIANRNDADLFISIHCNYIRGSRATWGSETYVMGLHTAEHNLNVAKRENDAILLEADYEKNYDYDPNSPEGHILLSMFQNVNLEQSILFAEKVEANFKISRNKSRGVKQAGFVVLKETTMPSVLVETGFLSNAQEERFLKTPEGQQVIAESMLQAFSEYKEIIETNSFDMHPTAIAEAEHSNTKPVNEMPQASVDDRTLVFKDTPPVITERSVDAGGIAPVKENRPKVVTEKHKPLIKDVNVHRDPKIIPLHQASRIEESQAKGDFVENNVPDVYSTNEIQFHVQLAAAPQPLDTNTEKWRTLGYLVEIVLEDDMYKYQARNFAGLRHAFDAKVWLRAKGFPDAFVVAYKNGQRISLEQAKAELGVRP